jgi:PTH1 family peptidyl-tRNA hydrolase
MKLIVGLGNPGTQYENTRHNAGFLALDFFLKDHPAISCQGKFNAQICEMHIQDESGLQKVFFIKPQSFMNLSGEVVREISSFYKVDITKDLLVLHDEKDLAFSTVKEARDSGSAGHNGVQNLIDELGTKDFTRIRIGVETREPDSPLPTDVFVLQPFTAEELEKLHTEVFPETNKLILKFLNS